MGCWNQTCGLTQLPIRMDEPVVCYILEPNNFSKYHKLGGSGFCYANDIFKPIAIPFEGLYDDYGGVIEIDEKYEVVYNVIMKEIEKGEYTLKPNRFNDELEKPKNLEELISFIAEERILKGEDHLGFMLVHKGINDKVIEEIGNRVPYSKRKTLRAFWKEKTDKYFAISKKLMQLNEKEVKTDKDRENRVDLYFKLSDNFYRDILPTYLELFKYDTELVKQGLIDIGLMETALNFCRKSWMIQPGSGSQAQEYYLNKIMADWVVQKTNDYLNDPENECGEDSIKETIFWYDDKEN